MTFKLKDGIKVGNVNIVDDAGVLLVNAPTATKLLDARTINGVSFDGTTNITITANTPNSLTNGSYLTGSAFNGSAAVTFAVDADTANTASKVVARDASGNFAAGTITASLSGNATSSDRTTRVISSDTDNNVASTPETLSDPGLVLNHKTNTSTGLSDGGTYQGVLTFRPFGTGSTWTGAKSHQLSFTDNGNLHHRYGTETTWSSWTKVYESDDADTANTASKLVLRDASGNFAAGTITASLTGLASQNLPLAGGTLTGFLTLHSDPSNALHAVTKQYVDNVAEGIHVKPAVKAATTVNLTATYDNGTLGVGATLNLGTAATLDIDGVTAWAQFDGILVKNQTNKFENGRYYVSQVGNASTAWILTRCGFCDEASEIPSSYVFVQEGTTYSGTGWVAIVEDFANFDVGVDDITWSQFTGEGTYTAGAGLDLVGTQFSHEDTSTVENLTATARTYVSGLTFDTFGHVTGYTTAAESVVDSNTTYSISTDEGVDAYSEKITLTAGGSGSGTDSVILAVGAVDTVYGLTIEESGDTITFKHADTSTQGSSDNSGNTFIQDITLDTYGHITAIGTATVSIGDGTLGAATGTTGSTATTVALNFSAGYSANSTTNVTINPVIGPSIVNLASTMTGATTGFIKKTAEDTYTLDTSAYLTGESDTLESVTGRGATTATAISVTNATSSTSTGTGALIVTGGVGVGGTLNATTVGGAVEAVTLKQKQENITTTATTTINLSTANNFYVSMTQNTTFAFSNVATNIGASGYLILKQDATGGHTFTLPTEVKTSKSKTIAQWTVANSLSLLTYYVVATDTIISNYIGDFGTPV